MNDSEFIELLNLYVDREIDAQDATRLEAEVVSDPKRRIVYRQYCQMHKACSLLGSQFREVSAPRTLGTRPSDGRSWIGAAAAAGLVAAACLAVVIGVRSRTASSSPGFTSSPALAVETNPLAAQPARVSPVRSELQPVLDVRSLALDNENSGTVTLASASGENDPFAWMSRVQMGPVSRPAIDRVFRSRPVLIETDSREPRPTTSLGAPVEMAAFRFQR